MTTDQRDDAGDDQLTLLLELADGPRELPPGEEERLLAALLATAVDGAADAGDHPAVVMTTAMDLDAAERWTSRRRRTAPWIAMVTAAGAVAAAAAVIVLPRLDGTPDAPEVAGVDEAVAAGLDLRALCERGRSLVDELAPGTGTPRGTPDAIELRDLATVLAEAAARQHEGVEASVLDRASLAVSTLRLQAQQVENGELGAATRTEARTLQLLLDEPLLLDALGCGP